MKLTKPSAAALAVIGIVLPGLAAPGPKEKDKPDPPPTQLQWRSSANNLKQIGLAMHNHHDVNNALPANYMTKDGKPGLSWRVAILPYIEEDKLFKEFKLDEPWDSESNKKLVERIPKLYAPVRGKADAGTTFYQMFAGKQTLLNPDGPAVRFADVTDGLSNTFMVVEGGKPVIWTKPDDIEYDGKSVSKLGGMFDGEFHALFGDGVVRRIPKGMDADVLKLLVERNDGQVVDVEGAIEKAKGK
jgi:hypothetical protein